MQIIKRKSLRAFSGCTRRSCWTKYVVILIYTFRWLFWEVYIFFIYWLWVGLFHICLCFVFLNWWRLIILCLLNYLIFLVRFKIKFAWKSIVYYLIRFLLFKLTCQSNYILAMIQWWSFFFAIRNTRHSFCFILIIIYFCRCIMRGLLIIIVKPNISVNCYTLIDFAIFELMWLVAMLCPERNDLFYFFLKYFSFLG